MLSISKRATRRIFAILKNRVIPKTVVYGRTACLGQAVVAARSSITFNPLVFNQQKTRCDMFLDWLDGSLRPDPSAIKPHLNREYVFPWIQEQHDLPWLTQERRAKLFVMDSFAELTDQKFTHKKEGWSFACHYNDLIHNSEFENQFDCHGLLPTSEFPTCYARFFSWLITNHPDSRVVYLHFPTKFDSRPIFNERAAALKEVMAEIALNNPFIRNIILNDVAISRSDVDPHPYHFSDDTVRNFIKEWDRLLW